MAPKPPLSLPSSPVRTLLVAEDPLVREGLLVRLGTFEDLVLVGEASLAAEVDARVLGEDPPEVILWDLGLKPDAKLAEVGERWPPLVVLVPDEGTARAVWAREVEGVLSRGRDGAALAAAIRAVAAGLRVSDAALGVEDFVRAAEAGSGVEALTPREAEVLPLLAEGLSNKEIAARLHVSEHTAKFHVNAILQKLGVTRRTEAVVRAARLGWIVL